MEHDVGAVERKISPEFAARLKRLSRTGRVRAVVLLEVQGAGGPTGRRQSQADRRKAVMAIRESTKPALGDIDLILERFGGKRLADAPNTLGSLPVETTASGINALAESSWVKAILEDQPIHSLQH